MQFLVTLFAGMFLYCFSTLVQADPSGQLIFAVDLIRHGDRTPTKVLPKAPFDWAEGLGKLTATGMQQEYQLGASLRSLYVEKYHLLPEKYTGNTISVRSTDLDRTLMSAQSFLMGLYPPGTGPELPQSHTPALPNAAQVFPVHTVPLDDEVLLIPDAKFYKFDSLVEKYVIPTPEWKQKIIFYHQKFPIWSQLTGVRIEGYAQIISIADSLYIDQLYQVPLPAGLSEEEAQQIIDLGHWMFVTLFKNHEIGKATGHLLLQTIATDLKQASQSASPLKYELFSAHDSTILAQLSAMGAPLQEAPPYASHLNYALYDNGNGNYTVQVKFNDEPVFIPSCGGVTCSLNQFVELAG